MDHFLSSDALWGIPVLQRQKTKTRVPMLIPSSHPSPQDSITFKNQHKGRHYYFGPPISKILVHYRWEGMAEKLI